MRTTLGSSLVGHIAAKTHHIVAASSVSAPVMIHIVSPSQAGKTGATSGFPSAPTGVITEICVFGQTAGTSVTVELKAEPQQSARKPPVGVALVRRHRQVQPQLLRGVLPAAELVQIRRTHPACGMRAARMGDHEVLRVRDVERFGKFCAEPIAYSEGFSPHPKVSFGDALLYWAGQVAGAFLGAVVVYLHYLPHWKETEDPGLKLADRPGRQRQDCILQRGDDRARQRDDRHIGTDGRHDRLPIRGNRRDPGRPGPQ